MGVGEKAREAIASEITERSMLFVDIVRQI